MFKNVARLFASPARIKILKFFALQPDVRIPLKTISTTLGIGRDVLEKEIRGLIRAEVILPRTHGKGTVYTLNRAHPLSVSSGIFLETATRPEIHSLRDMFRGLRGIVKIIATGILVNEPRSSLDVLIVVRKKRSHENIIARAIRKVERVIGLPVRYAVLESKEYEERLEARDRLLRDVFDFKHEVLVGE